MSAKFTTEKNFKTLTFDEVVDFLEKNGTATEKKAFKKACYSTKDGKTTKKMNWLNGKRVFCEMFCPDLIPVAQEKKPNKSTRIANW